MSACNARRKRPKSARRLRDDRLVADIRRIHTHSGETCGARRTHRQLRREAITAARCTVERLMREDGLEAVIRGQRRRTTIPEPLFANDRRMAARHPHAHRSPTRRPGNGPCGGAGSRKDTA
ncbi:IS3 family transposase [Streptomyces sp. NPDC001493]